MSKISVAIFDNQGKIIADGIESMLNGNTDIAINGRYSSTLELYAAMKSELINILIIVVYETRNNILDLIMSIASEYPRIKILIISFEDNEHTVFKSVKSGAKGFLTKDTGRNELIEAIHTIRNGFDYFSKPITNILLNRYLNVIKSEQNDKYFNFKQLSSRELEILKLWCSSFTNKEIADKLFISIRTVESHKNHIMQKLNMKTTVDIVKFAIRNNIIKLD